MDNLDKSFKIAGSILVVDDALSNLAQVRTILEKCGHSVRTVSDGRLAISQAIEEPPDLILLDIDMPDLDGFQVCEKLKSERFLRHVPVIFVSADHEPSDKLRAFSVGAVDYITKPFEVGELEARVESHLKIRRLQIQLEEANLNLKNVNARMARDLSAAARVQKAFLPRSPTEGSPLNFAWIYRPCNELGGDALNLIPLGENHTALYVLDVSGHGVASALTSVAISRLLSHGSLITIEKSPGSCTSKTLSPNPPAAVTAQLNDLFPFDDLNYQFVTMVYGVLNLRTHEFHYVAAGHPAPVHIPAEGPAVATEHPGSPIGLATDTHEEHRIRLGCKDRLFLYSDGLVEAENPSGEQFGKTRLVDFLLQNRRKSLQATLDRLVEEVQSWHGSPGMIDDVSVLAIELT